MVVALSAAVPSLQLAAGWRCVPCGGLFVLTRSVREDGVQKDVLIDIGQTLLAVHQAQAVLPVRFGQRLSPEPLTPLPGEARHLQALRAVAGWVELGVVLPTVVRSTRPTRGGGGPGASWLRERQAARARELSTEDQTESGAEVVHRVCPRAVVVGLSPRMERARLAVAVRATTVSSCMEGLRCELGAGTVITGPFVPSHTVAALVQRTSLN